MKRKIIPYNTRLKDFARKLRNDSTLGEILLWKEINNKQIHGYDFHRQKPLLNYIADFYCYELGLIIEVDGNYHNHDDQSTYDTLREKDLEEYDLTILRFTEQEVRNDMINVLRSIEAYIITHGV